MKRFLAFEQIGHVLDKLEDMQIEYEVYKEHAERVTPPEQLALAVKQALSNPTQRAAAQQRYADLRQQLEEMAANFLIEDTRQGPPPTDQTN